MGRTQQVSLAAYLHQAMEHQAMEQAMEHQGMQQAMQQAELVQQQEQQEQALDVVTINVRELAELRARAALADLLMSRLAPTEGVPSPTGVVPDPPTPEAQLESALRVQRITQAVADESLGSDWRRERREKHIRLLGGFVRERGLISEFTAYKRQKKLEQEQGYQHPVGEPDSAC
ncbi:MAG: hypothetical protein ACKVI4_16645 [Actinomycetales bacterium]|tara:strand:- start:1146 stop:1670 length:525 start_codon:yes stop_codon:yes gene_type:complete